MDFTQKQKFIKERDELAEQYPHVLCLYKDPPVGDITLVEFEELSYERVQVLRVLEQATLMGNKIYSLEWRNAVLGYLKKQNLRKFIRLIESTGCSSVDAESYIRREDYISHFILRLAYCRSLDLRNWFIAREIELFRMRFLNLSQDGLSKFIKENKLEYKPITEQEKEEIKHYLCQSTAGYSSVQVETSEFYKVPFIEVLDLVRNSLVFIHKGFAYIPSSELVSCIVSWMRSHLHESLAEACKKLPNVTDERVLSVITNLHRSYAGKDYSTPNAKAGLTAENLQFVRKSFPLCMRSLSDVLHTTHHLKHFGRLQFGLFLKGIGLSLEEAIKYWKSEFGKSIDEITFEKNYLYNIKHSYGASGKMLSYSPFGCTKIISSEPGPMELHGCPFKLWDKENLKQKMIEYGVNNEGIKEVIDTATSGHFQIACSKYFIYTHGGTASKQVITHPNQYFDESQEILNPKSVNVTANISNKRIALDASSSQSQQSEMDESLFDDEYDLSQVDDCSMNVDI